MDVTPLAGACFVAGSPNQCVEAGLDLAAQAERLGFAQISFATLGPDYAYSTRFFIGDVIPKLRGSVAVFCQRSAYSRFFTGRDGGAAIL